MVSESKEFEPQKIVRKSSRGALLIALVAVVLIIGLILIITGSNSYATGTMIIGIVLSIISFIILINIIALYNRLIGYVNKIDQSIALIDIQLKQRFDLIPNLVSTVKAYSKHEEDVFKEITELRSLASATSSEKQKIAYANNMVPKLRQIILLAENYPKLQSNELYRSLISELVIAEDKIVAARRIYDSNVNIYNTQIMTFPAIIVAVSFGFTKAELFKIDAGEKLNIKVSL